MYDQYGGRRPLYVGHLDCGKPRLGVLLDILGYTNRGCTHTLASMESRPVEAEGCKRTISDLSNDFH